MRERSLRARAANRSGLLGAEENHRPRQATHRKRIRPAGGRRCLEWQRLSAAARGELVPLRLWPEPPQCSSA